MSEDKGQLGPLSRSVSDREYMASNEGCHMFNCLRKFSRRQNCCHFPLLLLKDRETYRRQQNHKAECERGPTAARRLECHLILKYSQLWKYTSWK